MVEIYQDIQQKRSDLSTVKFDYKTQALWPETLGGAIMKRSRVQADVHGGNYVYDDEVLGYLHSYLAENGWKWQPSKPGKNGGAVLDLALSGGECRYVSAALELLFYAPAPYGFQLPEKAVKTVQYEGAKQSGFLSQHDPAKAFGLGYNIIDPKTKTLLEGFLFWPNHWVTEWGDDYYDANYNRIYRKLSDMSLLDVDHDEYKKAGETSYISLVTAAPGQDCPEELDGFYVRTVGGEYTAKTQQLAVTLNEKLGFELRTGVYVGPFPKPYDANKTYAIDLD
ncbi:hypothetical protein SAMN06265365_105274 [Tistlia consotensis]|uniref:Uncharacterized protein n=1 Tax=Tistlia consotensis USBA 355 TaxID=560819 RepID=A0A1Y6BMT8_9PROT|nr:hypothetical protein [Tistlia consotensis]SMF11640.1 hypothetical protein SAMN05428998_10524 [Tistlia consotensis USBA 355]SNR51765.1 hypothetical protein SAMN06265365_105274 [Tistlia consotensis]